MKALSAIYEAITGLCWHDWIWMRNEARKVGNGVLFFAERACIHCGREQSRISCFRHTGSWIDGRFKPRAK